MVLHQALHGLAVDDIEDARLGIEHTAPYVVDALALEPACVRRREALLLAVGDLARDVAAHHFAQNDLAVPRALEVAGLLAARLVLVEAHDLGEIAEFGASR